jgi:hypothetical protein
MRLFSLLTFFLFLSGLSLFYACTKTRMSPPVIIKDTLTIRDTLTLRDTVVGYPVKMGPFRPVTASSNAYVMQFFEYNPAPGQFLNTDIASESTARTIVGNEQGLVSLGAWGGYVVYGFDHTVVDSTGPDLLVIGNAFSKFAEPGVVWVMQDQNGNGKPDDTWFEIEGSASSKPGYIRNYSVTYYRPDPIDGNVPWKNNKGDSGYILTNIFNVHDYYPDNKIENSYTLTGTLLPSTNIDTTDPNYITSASFDYGYCDNSAGGDYIDLTTAIDATGKRVYLKGIDFVKIQTGIYYNMGWLGEQSTEVAGIADARLYKQP